MLQDSLQYLIFGSIASVNEYYLLFCNIYYTFQLTDFYSYTIGDVIDHLDFANETLIGLSFSV